MTRRGTAAGGLIAIALLALAGCGAASTGSSASASNAEDLLRASSGVCHAITQLPGDVPGSVRAFQDEAHDVLHALAAIPSLNRGMAAQVLVTMSQVESDIASGPTAQSLRDHLDELLLATDSALKALGQTPPDCPATEG